MLKNKSLKLYYLIKDTIYLIDKTSKETYSKLENLLQEASHSFGFKPLSDISSNFVDGIDNILNNEDFSYFIYESYSKDKKVEKEIIKQLKNKEKELLKLLMTQLEILIKKDTEIGKIFKMFLTDLQDDTGLYGFQPIDTIIYFIIEKLDFDLFEDLNQVEEYNLDIVDCWFYWFSKENEFGKKEFPVGEIDPKSFDVNSTKIKNFNDFYKNVIKNSKFYSKGK